MAIFATKCILILSILLVTSMRIHGQQQVPCYFPFGDSIYDNGNNNDLVSLAKANYIPYGVDFYYGPTGRFTNGFTTSELIGQRLGFSTPLPPFATARGSTAILRGVNYASGAGGILDESAIYVGQRVPMNQQLSNHQETVNKVATLLGNRTAAENHLRQCIYLISEANNDILNNYYFPATPANRLLFTPEKFADRLIQQFSQQLTTLYNLQARKVAVMAAIPLGCLPQALVYYPTNGTACVEFINDSVQIFNTKLVSLIDSLNRNLVGAKFTFIDTYAILSTNLTTALGIKVPNVACCEVNSLIGTCFVNGGVCSNRDEYTYFDNLHMTQIVANYTASRAYIAQSPSDATPFDIRALVQQ